MFGEIKTSLFLVVSPLPSFLPTLAIPSCPYPRYVGRPLRSLTNIMIFTETWLNSNVPDSAIDLAERYTLRADRTKESVYLC